MGLVINPSDSVFQGRVRNAKFILYRLGAKIVLINTPVDTNRAHPNKSKPLISFIDWLKRT